MLKRRNINRRGGVPGGVDQRGRSHLQEPFIGAKHGAWAVKEGSLQVVKVVDFVSSELKKEVCDSFVATAIRPNICEWEVEGWFSHVMKIAVELKRLNHLLLWVKPISSAESQRSMFSNPNLRGSSLRCLDQWTEDLGPVLKPCWARMERIPLHAWSKSMFRCQGGCLG